MALGFGGSIQVAAVISVFAPALGNIVHSGQAGLVGKGLPAGSGIYHLNAVAAYRDGGAQVLDVSKLEGVVTFPSFHAVMGIVLAWALRGGWIGLAAGIWCVLVGISTVPIGGHYVVDVVAGAVLWCAIMATARAMERDRRGQQAHGPTALPAALAP